MSSIIKEKIKNNIPEHIIIKIKKIREYLSILILKCFGFSTRASSFYYSFISRSFWREHYGVIYGKLKYYHNLKAAQESNYLIRRNIHRLEKGLIMRPRRNIFAVDYIQDTVNSYKNAREELGCSSIKSELQWAHDVLKQYFNVVGSHPVIDRARKTFLALKPIDSDQSFVPYKRNLNNPPPVNYEQFLKLSYQRRSVRWYLQKPVPRELIDKAIVTAALSPSACNRQPFEFRIFDDPELVQKIASIPMGTKGFYQNFPAIIVVVGKLRAYFSERDRHVIYIDSALASMSLMYALETLGLSSCPINWPDIQPQESKMISLLNLEPDERVIMLISLGYPDPEGMVAYSQKKTLDQIRRFN